jgi:hypothetical protein
VDKAIHGLCPLDRPQATPRVAWVDGPRILRWLPVDKAIHGLCPLDRPQATPRVAWVDGPRILRWLLGHPSPLPGSPKRKLREYASLHRKPLPIPSARASGFKERNRQTRKTENPLPRT